MKEFIGREFISNNEEETRKISCSFSKKCNVGDIILLTGDLGAGKTVFAKGFAEGLGISDDVVSPTFTLMNNYDNRLLHLDLYRLNSYEELASIGAEEFIYSDFISLIEWPERVGFDAFVGNVIVVTIEKIDNEKRKITFKLR